MSLNYKERQKFSQPLFFLLVLIISLVPAYLIFNDYSLLFSEVFAIIAGTYLISLILLYFIFVQSTLITTIDSEKISIHWSLFKHKFFTRIFHLQDIKAFEIVKYGFVGYGYRMTRNYGTILNARGNQGLLLKLKNQNLFTIGTQKPKEILSFLNKNNI